MQAFAQSTPPSLPSLPALPGVPQPAASPSAISMPTLPSVPQALTPASPSAAVAPMPEAMSAGTTPKGSETPPVTTDLPDYATPPIPADTTALPTPTPVAGGLPPISGLEMPGAAIAPGTSVAPAPNELFGNDDTVSVPEIRVVREKAPLKTWQTKLAPSIIPPKTNFIYKRELLPEAIYRTAYGKENRHLPSRATREQYEWLMFTSIAKNDVETTRSLLNAGTSLKAINVYGETPLMFAERTGARDVAALIQARGGR